MIGKIRYKDNLPAQENTLYDLIEAKNGIFIRSSRPELSICFQVKEPNSIDSNLKTITPYIRLNLPPVPQSITEQLIDRAEKEAEKELEILFHLSYLQEWNLHIPAQMQTSTRCQPYEINANNAIIEAHSHHKMAPIFSQTDNEDEIGFKIYSCLSFPKNSKKVWFNTRVGAFGYYYTIKSEKLFQLPERAINYGNII